MVWKSQTIMTDMWHSQKIQTEEEVPLPYLAACSSTPSQFVCCVQPSSIRCRKHLNLGIDTVNSLPAWFPGMSFKNDVMTAIQQVQEATNAPFDFVISEIVGIFVLYYIMKILVKSSTSFPAKRERGTVISSSKFEFILRVE